MIVKVDRERCKGCGLCIEFCKERLLKYAAELNGSGYRPVEFIAQGCSGCGNCYFICPDAAIEIL